MRKPDGSVRYCIDFRRLNAKTVVDAEPIPNQEVILNKMGDDNFISRIDLMKGFWQVPIREEDRKYFVGRADMYMRDRLHLSGYGAALFADELSAAVDSGMGSIKNIFGSKHCLN